MTRTMFLRQTPNATQWCWWAGKGDRTEEYGSLADARAALKGNPVVVLIPGQRILITTAAIPVRNQRQARSSAPWALEDHLTEEVEDLHFALATQPDAEGWPVAIVARSYMTALLDELDSVGITPAALVPEPLALLHHPHTDQETAAADWTLFAEPDTITVRTGRHAGFSVRPEWLPAVLDRLKPPPRIDRAIADGAFEPTLPDTFADAVAAGQCTATRPAAVFEWRPASSINLLQGPYNGAPDAMERMRPYLPVAAGAAMLGLVLIAQMVIEKQHMNRQIMQLEQEISSVFHAVMPDSERMVQPQRQLQARLDMLTQSTGQRPTFTNRLQEMAEVIGTHPDTQLEALDWRNQRFDLTVQATNMRELGRLQNDLQARHFTTELQRIDQMEDRVRGELRLEGSGS